MTLALGLSIAPLTSHIVTPFNTAVSQGLAFPKNVGQSIISPLQGCLDSIRPENGVSLSVVLKVLSGPMSLIYTEVVGHQ